MAEVKCYSGNEYAERPLSFLWEGAQMEVERILARWRTPRGKVFRVRAAVSEPIAALPAGHATFDLIYDQVQDCWDIRAI
ncbi:MAG: hypothetical protein ACK4VW_06080 [Anaerolineales bacterium]